MAEVNEAYKRGRQVHMKSPVLEFLSRKKDRQIHYGRTINLTTQIHMLLIWIKKSSNTAVLG